MNWEEYQAALPDDEARDYLVLEMKRRDAATSGLVAQFQASFGMTLQQAKICGKLMQSLGNPVPYERIIGAMYEDQEPEDAQNVLGVQLVQIRSKLQGRMWIDTIPGLGLQLNAPDGLLRSKRLAPGSTAPTAPGAGASNAAAVLSEALSLVRSGQISDVVVIAKGGADDSTGFEVFSK